MQRLIKRTFSLASSAVGAVAVIVLALGVSACSTTSATSFAIPTHKADEPVVANVNDARAKALVRGRAFQDAANATANGPQAFDLPTIVTGLVAVGGAVFGARSDLSQGAALATTGLVATRGYYAFSARAAAYQGGASALSCMRIAAESVMGVDPVRWSEALQWAGGDASDVAVNIRRLAPVALRAHSTIDGAIDDVDGLVRTKIGAPGPPDYAGYLAGYRANYAALTETKTQNADAATKARTMTHPLTAGETPTTANVDPALKAQALLTDLALTNALTELDQKLEECRLKAK